MLEYKTRIKNENEAKAHKIFSYICKHVEQYKKFPSFKEMENATGISKARLGVYLTILHNEHKIHYIRGQHKRISFPASASASPLTYKQNMTASFALNMSAPISHSVRRSRVASLPLTDVQNTKTSSTPIASNWQEKVFEIFEKHHLESISRTFTPYHQAAQQIQSKEISPSNRSNVSEEKKIKKTIG